MRGRGRLAGDGCPGFSLDADPTVEAFPTNRCLPGKVGQRQQEMPQNLHAAVAAELFGLPGRQIVPQTRYPWDPERSGVNAAAASAYAASDQRAGEGLLGSVGCCTFRLCVRS
jgi:hypothetical protein